MEGNASTARSARQSAAALFIAAGIVVASGARTASGSDSIWEGVYTAAQARRGQAAYTGPCDRCHGYKLDGASDDPDMLPAPPIAGPKFLRKWNGRSLATLFEYVRTTMPANNPGYLTDDELADIVAYMLSASGVPARSVTLPPDGNALAKILIAPPPQ